MNCYLANFLQDILITATLKSTLKAHWDRLLGEFISFLPAYAKFDCLLNKKPGAQLR